LRFLDTAARWGLLPLTLATKVYAQISTLPRGQSGRMCGMPYFVRIGLIGANQSGIGSRGWYIRRQQERVVVRWGAVEVKTGGAKTRFSWGPGWPKTTAYDETSVDDANQLVRRKTDEKTHGGYRKLPPGASIRPSTDRR
jgi:predicted DNA-binding WGR domain protein